jgi:hypothetical protein
MFSELLLRSGSGGVAVNGGTIPLSVSFSICLSGGACRVSQSGDVQDGEQVYNAGGIWSPR